MNALRPGAQKRPAAAGADVHHLFVGRCDDIQLLGQVCSVVHMLYKHRRGVAERRHGICKTEYGKRFSFYRIFQNGVAVHPFHRGLFDIGVRIYGGAAFQ